MIKGGLKLDVGLVIHWLKVHLPVKRRRRSCLRFIIVVRYLFRAIKKRMERPTLQEELAIQIKREEAVKIQLEAIFIAKQRLVEVRKANAELRKNIAELGVPPPKATPKQRQMG